MKYVSVVVPVYNTADYLDRCLQSIINQTYKDFEVILIDDGSTDGSDIICKKYLGQDKRIKYCRIQNSGVSVARNTGIQNASGEFLLFVDSDDYIDRHFLEELVKCQRLYECDIVKYSATISSDMNASMNQAQNHTHIYTSKEALEEYFYGDETKIKVQIWSGLYKRSLFLNLKFPEGKVYEDSYITPRLLASSSKIVYLDYPGYIYYLREGSIMHSGLSTEKISAYDLYKYLYYHLKESLSSELIGTIIEKWIYQYIYTYRNIVKEKRKIPDYKSWLKKIYSELKNDEKFLLKQPLGSSCKKQMKLFLISPTLFNFYIDMLEHKGEKNG